MKSLKPIAIVAVVVVFAISGVAYADSPPAGQQTFESKCAACHGKDGAGQTPMGKKLGVKDLKSPEVQGLTDAKLIEVTKKGKGKMPAYQGKLTDVQIRDIVTYIRSLAQ